ncbi:hypothetical protein L596_005117 [Steinernema carpocapsae]|uniref:Uncharacterized protein n=1 Tax=Steinernema carpocapsae TaxID=34508 RepID=A0A4U8V275_STECR|nr:hypothetical protein L596_005117 [Steinernema carpocapsae]
MQISTLQECRVQELQCLRGFLPAFSEKRAGVCRKPVDELLQIQPSAPSENHPRGSGTLLRQLDLQESAQQGAAVQLRPQLAVIATMTNAFQRWSDVRVGCPAKVRSLQEIKFQVLGTSLIGDQFFSSTRFKEKVAEMDNVLLPGLLDEFLPVLNLPPDIKAQLKKEAYDYYTPLAYIFCNMSWNPSMPTRKVANARRFYIFPNAFFDLEYVSLRQYFIEYKGLVQPLASDVCVLLAELSLDNMEETAKLFRVMSQTIQCEEDKGLLLFLAVISFLDLSKYRNIEAWVEETIQTIKIEAEELREMRERRSLEWREVGLILDKLKDLAKNFHEYNSIVSRHLGFGRTCHDQLIQTPSSLEAQQMILLNQHTSQGLDVWNTPDRGFHASDILGHDQSHENSVPQSGNVYQNSGATNDQSLGYNAHDDGHFLQNFDEVCSTLGFNDQDPSTRSNNGFLDPSVSINQVSHDHGTVDHSLAPVNYAQDTRPFAQIIVAEPYYDQNGHNDPHFCFLNYAQNHDYNQSFNDFAQNSGNNEEHVEFFGQNSYIREHELTPGNLTIQDSLIPNFSTWNQNLGSRADDSSANSYDSDTYNQTRWFDAQDQSLFEHTQISGTYNQNSNFHSQVVQDGNSGFHERDSYYEDSSHSQSSQSY